MDEKHDSKMTRFENYASFVVIVENLRFMVQKTYLFFPKISMKIFSDVNLYNLPTNENFCTPRKFHKNRKKSKFPKLYMGWSYRDEFWRLQMGSLGVVDGFETNSWLHRHSGCDFKNDEFSWIFEIFICGSNYSIYEIGRYRPENHDRTLKICFLMLEGHYIQ